MAEHGPTLRLRLLSALALVPVALAVVRVVVGVSMVSGIAAPQAVIASVDVTHIIAPSQVSSGRQTLSPVHIAPRPTSVR